MKTFFGGVEGGATHSMFMVCDAQANVLATVEGPGTNLFQLGLDETCHRVREMVKRGLEAAGLNSSLTLEGLGLSLSGCEVEEVNRELELKFKELYPDLSRHYAVCSDTIGTLLSASGSGGIVLIAGTGSNSLLVNPDGKSYRCGGWGHILGDEGGAFWIVQKAMKIYFDETDNLGPRPLHSTKGIEEVIFKYFGVKDRFGLLTFCYDKFVKSHFAGACKHLADLARGGDKMAAWVFEQAGRGLAQHIVALSPNFSEQLLTRAGGLPVVCIGSVWKSWDLLKAGFLTELAASDNKIVEISLLHLKVPMATGACYLGADVANADLVRSYSDNTVTFYNGKIRE